MKPINDLTFIINAVPESLIQFDPNVKEYHITVPSDCFGAVIRLNYEPEFYISIRSDRDAGRFGFADLDPEMGDYIAGTELPYYDYYKGYLLRLDKREACFEQNLDAHITIDAGSTEHGSDHYDIYLHRDCGKEIRSLFKEYTFFDEEFGMNMPYLLYVPSHYDRRRKYPLVICLHGTGERQEPISAVLKKTQMATVFAKDSESGLRECIVLLPKCEIHYDEDDNWTTMNQYMNHKSDSPFWPMPHLTVAWRLIEKITKEYRIDDKRLYLTGISSGAVGANVMATEHPNAFAALVTISGAANPQRVESLRDTPLWIFHAADDPVIVPAYTLYPALEALDKAGIKYRLTLYPEKRVFWQSGHFCWEVAYKDQELLEWIFSQRLGGLKRIKKKIGITPKDSDLGQGINEELNDIATRAVEAASQLDQI